MIDNKEFDSLYSEDITKKRYDEIINKINNRFSEICKKFLKIGRNGWYDYDTISYDDKDANGYFDPIQYKEHIGIIGEWIHPPDGYDCEFPTRWLW